jgi:myo-inositol 2-dehydrogenase/D-chiro-inositol 1-dehydrogenase
LSGAQLGLGLIGAGRIGRLHANNLLGHLPRARLLVVADVVEEAARQVGAPEAVTDYRRILDNPDIDAVLVCSATDTHARIIEEAAGAGKHIFCEKPIALSMAAVDRAAAAVERAGVLFQIGFNRRFDANYARVRQAVVEGEIGEPWLLHLISRDPEPPPLEYVRTSGGMFLDMTIHDFDMARFLIGSEVETVSVAAGVRVDEAIGALGDVDTALITLRFLDGTIASIDNSRQAVYGYDQRAELLGSRGLISTGNNYPNTAHVASARAVYRDLPLHFFLERYVDSYRAEMVAFVDAVLDGTPTPVGVKDGRAALALGLAALLSYQEQRPVRVSE